MLPVLGRGNVGGLLGVELEVVDGHGSVCQPRGQHVRVLGVDVYAHHTAVGMAQILRERGVLQAVDAQVARLASVLVVKVVWRENEKMKDL